MKKTILSLIAILLLSLTQAQEIKVKEQNESFSNGSHNALVVVIPIPDLQKIQKEWKSKMKDFGYSGQDTKGDETDYDNVKFKSLSNNPVDVFTKFEELKGDKSVRMMVSFDLGGAFMSSSEHKDKYDYFKKLVSEFAVQTSKDYVQDQLKDATKLLNNLTDKKKGLEKDNVNLDDDIKNYQEKIKKAQGNIERNKKDIEVKKTEMDAQKKVVDGVKTKLDAIK